MLNRY